MDSESKQENKLEALSERAPALKSPGGRASGTSNALEVAVDRASGDATRQATSTISARVHSGGPIGGQHIVCVPRPDATPGSEEEALMQAYRYILRCYE